MKTNPCYYCENRTATCRLDCKSWKEYVKERDERYQKKLDDAERLHGAYMADLTNRIKKRS